MCSLNANTPNHEISSKVIMEQLITNHFPVIIEIDYSFKFPKAVFLFNCFLKYNLILNT